MPLQTAKLSDLTSQQSSDGPKKFWPKKSYGADPNVVTLRDRSILRQVALKAAVELYRESFPATATPEAVTFLAEGLEKWLNRPL